MPAADTKMYYSERVERTTYSAYNWILQRFREPAYWKLSLSTASRRFLCNGRWPTSGTNRRKQHDYLPQASQPQHVVQDKKKATKDDTVQLREYKVGHIVHVVDTPLDRMYVETCYANGPLDDSFKLVHHISGHFLARCWNRLTSKDQCKRATKQPTEYAAGKSYTDHGEGKRE